MIFKQPLTKAQLMARNIANDYNNKIVKDDKWIRPFADTIKQGPTPNWLGKLAKKTSLPSPMPLIDVIKESCYYPASGFDISPIVALKGFVHSYVYVDYGVRKIDLLERIEKNKLVQGYSCLLSRELDREDVIPANWSPPKPVGYGEKLLRLEEMERDCDPFGNWSIWQRSEEYDDKHGPDLFSLVFLGGEGIACHDGMYKHNGITPKVLALIQPGLAFGGNWADFYAESEEHGTSLWQEILKSGGTPDIIITGNYGSRFYSEGKNCPFPNYSFIGQALTYENGFIAPVGYIATMLEKEISRQPNAKEYRDGWRTINLFMRGGV